MLYVGTAYYAARVKIQTWVPETLVFHVVLAWIIVITLSLTVCFRLVDAIYSRGRSLIKPFNILLNVPQKSEEKWSNTFFILFGRSIWRQNFVWVNTLVKRLTIIFLIDICFSISGENLPVRASRGVFTIFILSAVLFYALLNVIFAPLKEAALSPVKSYRISASTPSDRLENINVPAWDVMFVCYVLYLLLSNLCLSLYTYYRHCPTKQASQMHA